ncbi:MAG: hypothetical protein ACK6DC_18830 [Planctomycetota bacterium]
MTESDSKRSGTKGCLWAVGILFLVVLLVFSSLLSWWAIQDGRDRKLVQSAASELRNRGAPVDSESLKAIYESKTDPTDAVAWNKIFDELKSEVFAAWSKGVEIFDSNAQGAGWTETGWTGEAAERNLVAKTEDLRRRIGELVRKPNAVRFINDFDGFLTMLSHAQQQRQVQRLIATEFQVAFADRDSAACREAIQTSLGVARLSRADPFLVSHLINVACHGIAMMDVQRAIEYDVFNEQDLKAVWEMIANDELSIQRLPWMIQGERAVGLSVIEDPTKLEGMLDSTSQVYMKWVGPSHRDILNLVTFYGDLENLDISDIDALQTEAFRLSNSIENEVRTAGPLGLRHWILTSSLLPAGGAVVEALVRDVVLERLTRLALAMRLYEKRHGQFPDTLEALNEVGFDSKTSAPWGGKPFGYRLEEGVAVLWGTPPRVGPHTSDEPPELDDTSAEFSLEKMFYLRLRPSSK